MFSSWHFAPSGNLPRTANSFLDKLRLWLPNILTSLVVSIIGTIALTLLSYGLSAAIGFPIMPFILIAI
jgi:hypothetical protein